MSKRPLQEIDLAYWAMFVVAMCTNSLAVAVACGVGMLICSRQSMRADDKWAEKE